MPKKYYILFFLICIIYRCYYLSYTLLLLLLTECCGTKESLDFRSAILPHRAILASFFSSLTTLTKNIKNFFFQKYFKNYPALV